MVALAVVLPVMMVIGARFSFAANQAAAPNPNCALIVPANPLSAAGLATPYLLVAQDANQGPCNEANAAQAAFVQGTIIDPATGKVSVYNPLVIDQGQQPAAAPVVPQLPQGAAVGLWFGFNGTNLTLQDSGGSLAAGKCVNGLGNDIFGQFAYCNAPAFFTAANAAIGAGTLAVPALGTGKDGNACPTTRDFSVVDQDQSDNVTTTYLIVGNSAAQNTAANRANVNGQVQVNGSDNFLVDQFVDQAVGCTPFQAPDLADNGALTTSLALNELQAAAGQGAPVALVPPNDPMTQVANQTSVAKLNLYRAGVDQPAFDNAANAAQDYCQNMITIQQARLQQDRNLDTAVTSPDPAAANTLFSFLAQRLAGSFTNLGCQALLNVNNPVTVTVQNGIAVDATFALCGNAAANGAAANAGNANAANANGANANAGNANAANANGANANAGNANAANANGANANAGNANAANANGANANAGNANAANANGANANAGNANAANANGANANAGNANTGSAGNTGVGADRKQGGQAKGNGNAQGAGNSTGTQGAIGTGGTGTPGGSAAGANNTNTGSRLAGNGTNTGARRPATGTGVSQNGIVGGTTGTGPVNAQGPSNLPNLTKSTKTKKGAKAANGANAGAAGTAGAGNAAVNGNNNAACAPAPAAAANGATAKGAAAKGATAKGAVNGQVKKKILNPNIVGNPTQPKPHKY